MTASRSAALVRRWVALYTVGLPRDIRDARRAEIEDDLWSQAHEGLVDATGSGESGDVLARLVFGIWADITWRLEQRHRERVRPLPRSFSMSTRVVASLSIVGGSALALASIIWGMLDATSPVAIPGRLLFFTGFVGLAIAIWGLVIRFNDRMAGGVALLGAIGGIGSVSAALGTATPLGLVGSLFFLLPIGSTAVALDLSRHGTMPRGLAIVHAAVAFAVVVTTFAIWTDSPVGGLNPPAVPYALPWVPYALTWIGIGVSLLRGQPADKALPKPA
jgi:hypothetical protein